ncbi:DEAD/DEAH box helicase family protein [Gammaproteobacteria bacterium]|nr:DEAD/DEAH box helicase family protein [Gammaproteobacteria bacterium]
MSFLDNVKTKYETPGSSLGRDFIRPALAECILYRRETGWFRSSALRVWAGSIIDVLQNDNIKIEIIAYPEIDQTLFRSLKDTLSAEEKAKKLEEHRETILLKALSVQSNAEKHTPEVGRYIGELLSYLIASKKLEIKFVTLVNEENWKIVEDNAEVEGELTHIKRGYFKFSCGTYLSFTGSANESLGGLMKQGEVFYVYDSRNDSYKQSAADIKNDVDITWDENKVGYKTHKISSKLLKKIKKIAPSSKPKRPFIEPLDKTEENHEAHQDLNQDEKLPTKLQAEPTEEIKETFKLRPHQEKVLKNWILNGYKGIVQHATGSGKTITGIYAVKHFFEKVGGTNVIIIVPSTILQDQWMNEIFEHIPEADLYRIGGRIGSSSWKNNVKSNTSPSRLGKKQIVLGVRQSICKKTFYEQVNVGNHLMVLVDELHTIGAKESSNFLNTIQLKYKLGLSATYERANDYLGTKRIIDYFDKALEPKYGLSEAIADKRLVQYDYELLTVSLNAEEEESWIEQSKKISAEWAKYEANKAKKAMPGKLKMMLIERAKISKKASNKTKKAVDVIKKNYKHDEVQRWLVYCQDLEQLGELQQKLFKEGFICSVYYSDLEEETKKVTLEEFYNKGGILLSIKCLDEGVDIPAADHALILASSSNKREYIQRRGRVLRVDKNNVFKRAKVFDLMTVAQSLNDKYIRSLVRTELTRAFEFSEHARNRSVTQIKIEELLKKYNIDIKDSVYVDKDDISYEDDNIS